MKARVIETGEIEELQVNELNDYFTKDGIHYKGLELDFDYEPDYWDKLYHQAAIAAMQGMLGNSDYIERFTAHTIDGISFEDDLARYAKNYATVLVNRLKEEEK